MTRSACSPHDATTRLSEVEERVTTISDLARKAPQSVVQASIGALEVAAQDEMKGAFVARALRALTRLAELSTTRTLADAVGAASDAMVLLEALDHPGVIWALDDNPLAAARVRGVLTRQRLLDEEGGSCSAEEFGQLLGGLSRQAVDFRRKRGRILALHLGRHGYAYPVWQVHQGAVLPGLERVIGELRECDPWMQVGFMLNPNSWLGGETPLAALRRGEVDRVVAAAGMLDE